MELFYKVVKLEANQQPTVTYQKEFKASEPLFARRAAIMGAEELRGEIEANNDITVVVLLCSSPIEGLVSELPIHFIGGNDELHMLTHHAWPLETSLYYQYQYDTGGAIATYMDILVLPDVMEQVID